MGRKRFPRLCPSSCSPRTSVVTCSCSVTAEFQALNSPATCPSSCLAATPVENPRVRRNDASLSTGPCSERIDDEFATTAAGDSLNPSVNRHIRRRRGDASSTVGQSTPSSSEEWILGPVSNRDNHFRRNSPSNAIQNGGDEDISDNACHGSRTGAHTDDDANNSHNHHDNAHQQFAPLAPNYNEPEASDADSAWAMGGDDDDGLMLNVNRTETTNADHTPPQANQDGCNEDISDNAQLLPYHNGAESDTDTSSSSDTVSLEETTSVDDDEPEHVSETGYHDPENVSASETTRDPEDSGSIEKGDI